MMACRLIDEFERILDEYQLVSLLWNHCYQFFMKSGKTI